MIRVGLEFIQLPRWKGRVQEIVTAETPENLKKAWDRGKGVLVLASHLGNWEYGIAWGPAAGYGTIMVARLPGNSLARSLAVKTRTTMDIELVPRKKGMRGIIRGLNEKKLVVVALDQHSIKDNVVVEFFGRPAATSNGVAILALKYDAPVVPTIVWREGDRHRVRFLPEIELERTGDLDKDIQTNTQKFVRVIEEYIRKHPDQWLWMHRRWRLD
jgi:KDO2-lipid IV(A) lauroyltransferase